MEDAIFLKGVDITGVATGDDKFSGICEVAGKVVAAPYRADKLLVFRETETMAEKQKRHAEASSPQRGVIGT